MGDRRPMPSGQEPGLHENLESVADSENQPSSVMEAAQRIVERSKPGSQDAAGSQIISVTEPTRDRQKLEGIKDSGRLQNAVNVGRLNVGPGKLPGRDGFLIAVRTGSPKDDRAGQRHGSTGKKADQRKKTQRDLDAATFVRETMTSVETDCVARDAEAMSRELDSDCFCNPEPATTTTEDRFNHRLDRRRDQSWNRILGSGSDSGQLSSNRPYCRTRD